MKKIREKAFEDHWFCKIFCNCYVKEYFWEITLTRSW